MSLRKKLVAAGQGKHYLRTEPWVVYRFDPTPSSIIGALEKGIYKHLLPELGIKNSKKDLC
jgi:hypothetical protein